LNNQLTEIGSSRVDLPTDSRYASPRNSKEQLGANAGIGAGLTLANEKERD